MFGGFSYVTGQNLGDTWEYDGSNWTQVNTTLSPSARRGTDQSVYDSTAARVLVFGGNANGLTDQTWVYRSTTTGVFSALGSPCGATAITLSGSPPTTGQTLQLSVGNLGAAPVAMMMFGFSTQVWNGIPLTLDLGVVGLPGCELRTSVEAWQAVVPTLGSAVFSLGIPAQPHLLDFRFHCQAVALDLASPQPFQGTSALGRMIVGI
jgi:hypothetical protein